MIDLDVYVALATSPREQVRLLRPLQRLSLAERIAPTTGFRNIVVHHYLTVDPEKVGDILRNHLDDFEEFVMHVHDDLRREGYLKDEPKTE